MEFSCENSAGGVHIDGEITSGMIKIGRYKGSLLLSNGRKTFFNIEKGGKIVFAGAASFAKGSMVEIGGAAQVKIGSGMTSNANLIISCVDKIEIGNDCLIGWNCTLMDGDGHPVKHNGFEQKNCRKIEIGNHVWLASNVTVLKGTHISDNSVVGYGTIVSGTYNKTNVAILGNRGIAKVEDIEWQR